MNTQPNPAPTPRTDSKCVLCNYGEVRVPADFARTLERELAAKDAEIENLVWNLAGCDTLAMGYAKPGEFSKELARPALHSVSKLRAERDQLRAEVERLQAHRFAAKEENLKLQNEITISQYNAAKRATQDGKIDPQSAARIIEKLDAELAAALEDARSYKAARDFELANLTETRRQLAAAKEDTERMDWLEAEGSIRRDLRSWTAWGDKGVGNKTELRAAIDAARKAQP